MLELIPKRDALLQQETITQQSNERLRVQFAQQANSVHEWIKQKRDRLTYLTMNSTGTLESMNEEYEKLHQEVMGFKDQLIALEKINEVSLHLQLGCFESKDVNFNFQRFYSVQC